MTARGPAEAGYETEWSDESLARIFARYAKPIPARLPESPPSAWHATPAAKARQADRLIPVATDLACLVHGDGDAGDIANLISSVKRPDVAALLVVLAAMVDVDRTTDEVLGWAAWEPRGLEPCGTVAARKRHRRAGEDCDVCRDADNARKRAGRAAKREAAA